MSAPTIWTIGHSNRQQAAFMELLAAESIEALADVRRFPGSRQHPQFNRDQLEAALNSAGLRYHHFPGLGGRRTSRTPESPNVGWRVEAFNAYADHMSSSEFTEAFDELTALAGQHRTALMCAEALPWRCHRRLIADLLLVRGWQVFDVVGPRQVKEHALPDFAQVADGCLTYPGGMLF